MLQFVKSSISQVTPQERTSLPLPSPHLPSFYPEAWATSLSGSPSYSLILITPDHPASIPFPTLLLTLARGRLRVGLLVMQALAVHRDAAVAVEFFSLGWGGLVHGPAGGSLLVLRAAVPPGARGQAQPQRGRAAPAMWPRHVLCCVGAQGMVGTQLQPQPQCLRFSFPYVAAPGLQRKHGKGRGALRTRCTPHVLSNCSRNERRINK